MHMRACAAQRCTEQGNLSSTTAVTARAKHIKVWQEQCDTHTHTNICRLAGGTGMQASHTPTGQSVVAHVDQVYALKPPHHTRPAGRHTACSQPCRMLSPDASFSCASQTCTGVWVYAHAYLRAGCIPHHCVNASSARTAACQQAASHTGTATHVASKKVVCRLTSARHGSTHMEPSRGNAPGTPQSSGSAPAPQVGAGATP